ncbi:unnamed protein product [Penicillium nalgiovense]|nr:unnamed protein product [Penicillium nalgiovense]
MLPAGMEGHRFELLALISWVALFWGTYNTTERNYEGLVENWFLPGSSLTQLALCIADLCRAFTLLVRNHIDTHGLHPRCPNTRRVSYRNWLLSRMPIPQGIEADGSPERFAAMSLSRHKSIGTEDRVHLWYGAVRAFQSNVTRIARDSVSVPYHNDVNTIIGRFPTSMIPTEGR